MAHAVLEETNPKDGTVLESAPPDFSLRFSEHVTLRADSIKLFDADARALPIPAAKVVDNTVTNQLPADLAQGTYIVSWRVVSADGHTVGGAFTFSVGQPSKDTVAPPVPPSNTAVDVSTGIAKFFGYLGTLLAAGIALFLVLAFDGGQERRILHRLMALAAFVGLAGVAVTVPLHAAAVVGRGLAGMTELEPFLDEASGAPGLAVVITTVGLMAAVLCTEARRRSRSLDIVMVCGAACALAGFIVTGHTRTYGPRWIVMAADASHVIAAAVWLGGLVGVAIVLVVRGRSDKSDGGEDAHSSAAVVGRFSLVAGVTLAAVAGTGALLGWRIVGSLAALFTTTYGRLLLIKIALVGVVALMGAFNRYRLVPLVTSAPTLVSGRERLARTVKYEAVLIVVILGVTAALVDRSPVVPPTKAKPGVAQPQDERTLQGRLGSGDAAGRVTVVAPSSKTGSNTFEISLTDSAGEPLVPFRPPTLKLYLEEQGIGPLERPVTEVGPGRYEAPVEFTLPGRWRIDVVVRVSEFAMPTAQMYLDIT
jgi:copper transport protein